MTGNPLKTVTEIRITDPYILRAVAEEQSRTDEKSATKTACRLISERLAIRENAPAQSASQ